MFKNDNTRGGKPIPGEIMNGKSDCRHYNFWEGEPRQCWGETVMIPWVSQKKKEESFSSFTGKEISHL